MEVLGEPDRARGLIEQAMARPHGHRTAVLQGNLDLARGRIALAEGDQAGVRVVDDAVAALRTAGSPFHLAHGLLDRAGLTGSGDDREEARAIAERLGSAALTSRLATPSPERTSAASAIR